MAGQQNHVISSRIGIIGGGISGIAAAKQLSSYNPIVFEATDSIGGVWKHCSYNSTKLQSLRRDYEFSDYPWPERNNSSFPSHIQILEYLHSYATNFDLLKFVRFNSKVVELRFIGDRDAADADGKPGEYGSLLAGRPVWEVAVQTDQSQDVQVIFLAHTGFNPSFFFSFFLSFRAQTKPFFSSFFFPLNFCLASWKENLVS